MQCPCVLPSSTKACRTLPCFLSVQLETAVCCRCTSVSRGWSHPCGFLLVDCVTPHRSPATATSTHLCQTFTADTISGCYCLNSFTSYIKAKASATETALTGTQLPICVPALVRRSTAHLRSCVCVRACVWLTVRVLQGWFYGIYTFLTAEKSVCLLWASTFRSASPGVLNLHYSIRCLC